MPKHVDVREVRFLQALALERGGQLTATRQVSWDVSGRCSSPIRVERTARKSAHPTEFHEVMAKHRQGFSAVDIDVPCRKCPACLAKRARQWAMRARLEIARNTRTWFGTLTLSPANHYLMQLRAEYALGDKGTAWDKLTATEKFDHRHREISKEITLWLKRVRKESGAMFRYILVAEAHKSGLPHYHLLLHEWSPLYPIRHSILAKQWKLGFTQFKLVDQSDPEQRTAWYVCKYLSKSAVARVRASGAYGKDKPSNTIVCDTNGETRKVSNVEEAPPKREEQPLAVFPGP